MKKIPMRSCVVTSEKCEKKDLLRVVRDNTGRANGRGAYLKKDIEVIKKAKMNKILDRRLEVEVEDSIYEDLINMI